MSCHPSLVSTTPLQRKHSFVSSSKSGELPAINQHVWQRSNSLTKDNVVGALPQPLSRRKSSLSMSLSSSPGAGHGLRRTSSRGSFSRVLSDAGRPFWSTLSRVDSSGAVLEESDSEESQQPKIRVIQPITAKFDDLLRKSQAKMQQTKPNPCQNLEHQLREAYDTLCNRYRKKYVTPKDVYKIVTYSGLLWLCGKSICDLDLTINKYMYRSILQDDDLLDMTCFRLILNNLANVTKGQRAWPVAQLQSKPSDGTMSPQLQLVLEEFILSAAASVDDFDDVAAELWDSDAIRELDKHREVISRIFEDWCGGGKKKTRRRKSANNGFVDQGEKPFVGTLRLDSFGDMAEALGLFPRYCSKDDLLRIFDDCCFGHYGNACPELDAGGFVSAIALLAFHIGGTRHEQRKGKDAISDFFDLIASRFQSRYWVEMKPIAARQIDALSHDDEMDLQRLAYATTYEKRVLNEHQKRIAQRRRGRKPQQSTRQLIGDSDLGEAKEFKVINHSNSKRASYTAYKKYRQKLSELQQSNTYAGVGFCHTQWVPRATNTTWGSGPPSIDIPSPTRISKTSCGKRVKSIALVTEIIKAPRSASTPPIIG